MRGCTRESVDGVEYATFERTVLDLIEAARADDCAVDRAVAQWHHIPRYALRLCDIGLSGIHKIIAHCESNGQVINCIAQPEPCDSQKQLPPQYKREVLTDLKSFK